uniref:DUF5655 domain-containing protein n=1 Tax=Pseudomonas phage RVTF4 TaxID=3236931 RepID=A0AB39CCU9_9VIRU
MMLREHTIVVDLWDAKQDYQSVKEVLTHKLGKTEFEGAPKLTWCINNVATRAVVIAIGKDQFVLYTTVDKQAHPQDWAWIDQRFNHDDLHHLAKSDVRMGMKYLLAEARGEKIV